MLQKGAIKEIALADARAEFFSSFFLVPKKDKDVKPVINQPIYSPYDFKIEELIHPWKDWIKMTGQNRVDLKDAYFTIPMADRQFFYFTVQKCHYHFITLRFSLLCAPWVFTKTLRSILTLLT